MNLKKLGLVIVPVLMFAVVGCKSSHMEDITQRHKKDVHAMPHNPATHDHAGHDHGPGGHAASGITVSSRPAARGNRISVVAGNTVTVNLSAKGAISASRVPAGAKFSASGDTARLTWKTNAWDTKGSPYNVAFSATDGSRLNLTISVLGSK